MLSPNTEFLAKFSVYLIELPLTTRELLEDRIVELVFCPWDKLPCELIKLGLTVQTIEEGEGIVINNGHQVHGMSDVDPPTKAMIISAALSGSFRVGYYFPGLMPKIEKRWKENNS